jgi:ATP-dependent DNA helicase RecG
VIPWPSHPAFQTPLGELGRISPLALEQLEKKGLILSSDLLTLPPLRYQDRRVITPLCDARQDTPLFFCATVSSLKITTTRSGKPCLIVNCEDLTKTGAKGKIWFFQGLNWIAKAFKVGRNYAFYGTPSFLATGGRSITIPSFTHPDFFDLTIEDVNKLLGVFPIYGTLKGITSHQRANLLSQILDKWPVPTILPEEFLLKNKLKDPTELIRIVHLPPNIPGGHIPLPRQTKTFRALGLLELTIWRLFYLKERFFRQKTQLARTYTSLNGKGEDFIKLLPFSLTSEQTRVISVIKEGLLAPSPATILLQGEVGSGKTAVVASILFTLAGYGKQVALVAPTELLARQHLDFLAPFAQKLGINLFYLTGTITQRERKGTLSALQNGTPGITVGTQAILGEKVNFSSLSLAVIDEQHRFGVGQRLCLREKNPSLDLISMSATPIPRSLSQVLYGDMDIVNILGTLPGRSLPDTYYFPKEEKEEAYKLFVSLIEKGEKGFLISPRIGKAYEDLAEEEENQSQMTQEGSLKPSSKGPSLADMERELKSLAPDIRQGTIHGRQDKLFRSKVMQDFRAGELQVLIATTIVEVGVDIPGANVMLVEGAENMGLAQLHQLRGRVGRGGGKASLILLAHSEISPNAALRFSALQSGADGYELAELDLELRGPGEDIGLKQSGWPKFSFLKFPRDLSQVPRAHQLALELMALEDKFSNDLTLGLEELQKSLLKGALGV